MEKIIHDDILGVRCDAVTMPQAVARALSFCKGIEQHMITTPNPEIILAAQKNPLVKDVLNKADLALPDGAGVLWASAYKNKKTVITERVAGVDFMTKFCGELAIHGHSVFLLGAWAGVAALVEKKLHHTYPSLKIVGTHCGSPRDEDFDEIRDKIQRTKPLVLFVAFGAPNQELWIAEHLHELPSVKVAVGVGGSFDFIGGVKKRAPHWMQKLSLEWLFRLIQEPSRIKRIVNATIVFPFKVITHYSGKRRAN